MDLATFTAHFADETVATILEMDVDPAHQMAALDRLKHRVWLHIEKVSETDPHAAVRLHQKVYMTLAAAYIKITPPPVPTLPDAPLFPHLRGSLVTTTFTKPEGWL